MSKCEEDQMATTTVVVVNIVVNVVVDVAVNVDKNPSIAAIVRLGSGSELNSNWLLNNRQRSENFSQS